MADPRESSGGGDRTDDGEARVDARRGRQAEEHEGEDGDDGVDADDPASVDEELTTEELRARVEEQYDFDDFGPREMEEMSVEEWEAVFDHESWITGSELLDRVERELRGNVHRREVFAVVERVGEGDDDRVVAYSDEGYVVVRPDGSIQGTGTILRDVEPMVALCSMEDYDVPEVDDDAGLPHPDSVAEGSGDLGNKMLQVVGGATLLSGVGFVLAWLAGVVGLLDLGFAGAIVLTLGFLFLVVGGFLFMTVANARLSDRMRSEQYRDRLRSIGAGSEERPEFMPDEAFEAGGREIERAMAELHQRALEADDRSERGGSSDQGSR